MAVSECNASQHLRGSVKALYKQRPVYIQCVYAVHLNIVTQGRQKMEEEEERRKNGGRRDEKGRKGAGEKVMRKREM